MDSNAPPKSRGTPIQCLNAEMYKCINEEWMEDQCCWRFARGKPVVEANMPVTCVFFRSTGRDGPPEWFETIFGAWLARGTPGVCVILNKSGGSDLVLFRRSGPDKSEGDKFIGTSSNVKTVLFKKAEQPGKQGGKPDEYGLAGNVQPHPILSYGQSIASCRQLPVQVAKYDTFHRVYSPKWERNVPVKLILSRRTKVSSSK